MKLYFYFLEFSFNGRAKIRFEECEATEGVKAYYPKVKFPSGYYERDFPKFMINQLKMSSNPLVVLDNKNHKEALRLFKANQIREITRYEKEVEFHKNKLKFLEKAEKEFIENESRGNEKL